MAAWLVTPVGADQVSAQVAHGLLEVAPGKALVGQDAHPGPDRGPLQQRPGDLTLPKLGGGQTPGVRHAGRGGQK
jgi:hypothetical protein